MVKRKNCLMRIKNFYQRYRKALLGAFFVLLGVLLIVFPLAYRYYIKQKMIQRALYVAALDDFQIAQPRYDHGPIKADAKILEAKEVEGSLPIRVIIPRLGINLAVTPAKVVDGVWEIPEKTAAFGLGSAPPAVTGNSVIFAHARKGLFYPLRDIKENDEVYVLTNNQWFAYRVRKIEEVLPNQVEVIAPTPDRTLTLYTCSSFADSKRLVVVAKPV